MQDPIPLPLQALAPDLCVGPQLTPAGLAALTAAGFRSVICNRPDGEGPDQAPIAELERAAAARGLQIAYLPTDTSAVSPQQIEEFARLMEVLPKPVYAYCRTGRRSASLWAHTMLGRMPLPQILETTRRAGFDLADVLRAHDADR